MSDVHRGPGFDPHTGKRYSLMSRISVSKTVLSPIFYYLSMKILYMVFLILLKLWKVIIKWLELNSSQLYDIFFTIFRFIFIRIYSICHSYETEHDHFSDNKRVNGKGLHWCSSSSERFIRVLFSHIVCEANCFHHRQRF